MEHLKDISEHGVHLPANMIGLLPDQISELKLCEPDVQLTEPSQGKQVMPSESLKISLSFVIKCFRKKEQEHLHFTHSFWTGFETDPDPLQRRNGKRPTEAGRDILEKTAGEASAKVSRENVAGMDTNTSFQSVDFSQLTLSYD